MIVSQQTPENQITPLNISTPDGETLFAWHVLPLGLYARHEVMLSQQPAKNVDVPVHALGSFELLQQPGTRLIVNCQYNSLFAVVTFCCDIANEM